MPDESGPAEASTAAALDIRSLRKEFGTAVALDGISLRVPNGSIFGFLGPNGAGKTTTIRIVTGLAHATAGTVRVLGRDLAHDRATIAREIGFLPDVPGFYDWMTAVEFLGFTGRLFGLGARRCASAWTTCSTSPA
ncbi:MAG: ATP-binding cassette domain-containing protein [Gemmatimonadetes bacterium]|nr:ATP-binding cassette domain-containing protein [Gemmatimonadota bacterium]